MTVLSAILLMSSLTATINPPVRCREVVFQVSLNEGEPADQRLTGELCSQGGLAGKTLQVLIHGSSYDRRYWRWPYRPNKYSYVDDMLDRGYATLALDRIGTGQSSKPADGVALDMHVAAFTIHQAVTALRARNDAPNQIVLVGFSLGSFIATIEAGTHHDVDGVVLTSYSHTFGPAAIASFTSSHPANEEPQFHNLPPTYLTTQPGVRDDLFFDVPKPSL